jgi:parvulin-like peptidyl-prolyl isomerase
MNGRTVIAAFVLVMMVSCTQKEDQRGAYLAKVGPTKITTTDLEKEYKTLPEFAQGLFQGPEGKEKFLDELVKKEMLYQEALKKGLDKDPEFKRKLEEFKKLTLIGQLLENEIEAKAGVTEQDVKEYYEQHKDELASVSQIRASHILVESKEEAEDVRRRIMKGEDFSAIARKVSIDKGSAENDGDLGYIRPGQLVPEFEDALSRLKAGEVSEPVKTKFGYHIIKVTEKKMGKPVEFEKVKNVIYQRLAAERQKDVFDSYIQDLRKNYKVEINKEALAKFAAQPEQGAEAPDETVSDKEESKK